MSCPAAPRAGVARHEPLELGDELVVAAQRQVRFDTVLHRRQSELYSRAISACAKDSKATSANGSPRHSSSPCRNVAPAASARPPRAGAGPRRATARRCDDRAPPGRTGSGSRRFRATIERSPCPLRALPQAASSRPVTASPRAGVSARPTARPRAGRPGRRRSRESPAVPATPVAEARRARPADRRLHFERAQDADAQLGHRAPPADPTARDTRPLKPC